MKAEEPLMSSDFFENNEPFTLFSQWLDEAQETEPNDPNAMALATVDASGMPNVRMVLLKGFDEQGFVFYTNSNSQKGSEIDVNAKAAFVMHWKSLRRQVRARGAVQMVSAQEADEYFASRPRLSRIGAWASAQSSEMQNRFDLEKAVAEVTLKYPIGDIPRPPHWNGYRIVPQSIEFWHDRPYRLHDRVEYFKNMPEQGWQKKRLYP